MKGEEGFEERETGSQGGGGTNYAVATFKHVLSMGMVELMRAASRTVMLGIGPSCKAAGDGKT